MGVIVEEKLNRQIVRMAAAGLLPHHAEIFIAIVWLENPTGSELIDFCIEKIPGSTRPSTARTYMDLIDCGFVEYTEDQKIVLTDLMKDL